MPRKNVQFESYAKFRIRGAILDSLRDMDWSPRDLRRKARRLESHMQKLQTELGRSASEPELAQGHGDESGRFPAHAGRDSRARSGQPADESLEDGRENDLSETIAGPANQDPLLLCLQGERKEMLADAIAELPEREQQVLALYYHEELTMKEVGAVLGVGESRVSQIHSVAVARLRAALEGAQQARTAALASAVNARKPAVSLWKRY